MAFLAGSVRNGASMVTGIVYRTASTNGMGRMKRCPQCGALGLISVEPLLAAKPQGSYSIAGVQPKVVAEARYVLTCAGCTLRVEGRLENAVFDERAQTFTGGLFVADEPVSFS